MTETPESPSPGESHSPSAGHPYTVGYRRPPLHTRFKPGESGNRKGRPKRQRNVRTVVEETLNQRIKIREGNSTRSITKFDGVILTMTNGALKGDAKAVAALMSLLRSLGMTDEAPQVSDTEPFTNNDEALVADFLRRRGVASASPSGSENTGPSNSEHNAGSTLVTTAPDGGAKS